MKRRIKVKKAFKDSNWLCCSLKTESMAAVTFKIGKIKIQI
jgi:hypothetical protein